LHGTAILCRLVEPWAGSNRVVCADSYFASVDAAERLLLLGLRFIDVEKTAIKRFPMRHLSEKVFSARGDRTSIVMKHTNGSAKMVAVVWMDRDRRYFIATVSSTREGDPYSRTRWRQIVEGPARFE
jgi:Transposase IS4